jgi:excisionase family DNA binding protein
MAAKLEDISNLPDWPLHLSDIQAAAYFGLSATTFRTMVDQKEIPAPTIIRGRKVWFRPALDATGANLAGFDLGTGSADLDRELDEWRP